jgi:hypothetical protein
MLALLLSSPMTHGLAALRAVAGGFQDFFAVVREAHATAARFETLAHLSDAELARRGLKREGLAQVVIAEEAEAQV